MSLYLNFEKEKVFSTQEQYDIINSSIEAAYDDGFMNSFIFERAIYIFSAIVLYEDRKDEIAAMAAENINSAWDALIKDGTIEQMQIDFPNELERLAEDSKVWFDEYTQYAHSARGLLDSLQTIAGDLMGSAQQQFQELTASTDLQDVLKLGDEWGMNRKPDIVKIEDTGIFE